MISTPVVTSTEVVTVTSTRPFVIDWFPDSFNRDNGPVGNGWVDASTVWPESFDEVVVSGNAVWLAATHEDGFTEPPDPDQRGGHGLLARDVGLSDDFAVRVEWYAPSLSYGFHQVSPAAFIDLNAASSTEMGVLPIWDVSIPPSGATYIQNAFRAPHDQWANHEDYYVLLGGSQGGSPVTAGTNVVEFTCRSGQLSYMWNGITRGSPIAVPSFASGRTYVGLHVVAIDWIVGGEYPWGDPVTEVSPALVNHWQVRAL